MLESEQVKSSGNVLPENFCRRIQDPFYKLFFNVLIRESINMSHLEKTILKTEDVYGLGLSSLK